MIFLKLKEPYKLRKWSNTEIVVLGENRIINLSKEESNLLIFCQGFIPLKDSFLDDNKKNIFVDLVNLDILQVFKIPSFLKSYQKLKKYDNVFINNIHWDITNTCNFNCSYCYMNCNKDLEDLSFPIIKKIIKNFKKTGIYSVSLSGGEAIFRKDFFKIIKYLFKNDITISQLYTNGSLLNNKVLKKFNKLKWFNPEIVISFDDPTQKYRTTAETSVDILKTIENFSKDYRLSITTTLGKNMYEEALQTFQLLKNFPIHWKIAAICGEFDMEKTIEGQRKKLDIIKDLINIWYSLKNEQSKILEINFDNLFKVNNFWEPYTFSEVKICSTYSSVLSLDYRGNIKNCVNTYSTNILENSLQTEIQSLKTPLYETIIFNKKLDCTNCKGKSICCSFCPAAGCPKELFNSEIFSNFLNDLLVWQKKF